MSPTKSEIATIEYRYSFKNNYSRTYISFRLSQYSPIPVLIVSYFPRTTNQCASFFSNLNSYYIQLYYSLYTASYTLPTTRKNGARPYDKRKKEIHAYYYYSSACGNTAFS